MDRALKIGISGIRGIPGKSLTPEIIISLTRCFAEYLGGGQVLVGRDPRGSSQTVKYQIFSGLFLGGADIIDLGVVPTPTVQIMVRELKASGGIMITASHNPLPWNGLKFVSRDGLFLTADQFQSFLNFFLSRINSYRHAHLREIKNTGTFFNSVKIHLGKVLATVDVARIRQEKFKVVIDVCNGAGKDGAAALMENLNCEYVLIYPEHDGTFHRTPEPVPANLTRLKTAVIKHHADIGFALDPDGDRLAIVTEKGQAPGEEYTLALVADFVLRNKKGPLVTNLSTSRLIDDLGKKYRVPVFRTKIGEINVAEVARKKKAILAGEGNGGVIWPEVGWGRDAFSGMALILNSLAKSGRPISRLVNRLPRYFFSKDKYDCSSLEKISLIVEKLTEAFARHKLNLMDGLKIEGGDWWLHIRGSNTEPIIRIIAEAPTQARAKYLTRDAIKKICRLDRQLFPPEK